MKIEIPDEPGKRLCEVSKELQLDKDQVVSRAILLYMDSIQKLVSLKREMNAWDELSDEALRSFESAL